MSTAIAAEQSLRDGAPAEALHQLQDAVRANPSDAKLRIFLFQLLCVLGKWERAIKQLEVAMELDPGALGMGQVYRAAVQCELLREQVFAGKKVPMLFGEPEAWLALLIESLLASGKGSSEEASRLRTLAYEQAPESSGVLDGRVFSWLADADMRLGPVLEAIINGRYYWVPFSRLTRIHLEAPEDLRDMVWAPAHLDLENGGEAYALVPARYPGSATSHDATLVLGRRTEWLEPAPNFFCGVGQRVLTTDTGDVALLEVRNISIGDRAPAGT